MYLCSLYRDPRILVLDDATSSRDTRTERKIASDIAQLGGAHTLRILSHGIAVVEPYDEICALSHGRILDRGRHRVLLESCDVNCELHKLQNAWK